MKKRVYPAVVSLLGGAGLGLALTYFVGVALVFVPGMEEWAKFFMDRAVIFLVPPYILLLVHMVLRNHVGRFLLKDGAYEEAIRYGSRRAKRSPLRSQREASNQTMVWVLGLIGLQKYEEAQALLDERWSRLAGEYRLEAARWRLELALRSDERELAELILESVGELEKKGRQYAAFKATEAELALRNGEEERYRDCVLEAIWAVPDHGRAQLSRVLGMVKYEVKGEDVLESLERIEEFGSRELPARGSELQAMKAQVLWRAGDKEAAREVLADAKELVRDEWSEKVILRAEEEVGQAV